MNQKKLDPSEADLRTSILDSIAKIINRPTEEELSVDGWITAKQLASHLSVTYDSVSKKLQKQVEKGEMESKQEICKCGNSVVSVNFYRIANEITRAY